MAKSRKRHNEYRDFAFISQKSLRSDIEDALGFAAWLITKKTKNKIHKRELYRVVVLYIASVVEALCSYLLDENNLKIEETKYKSPTTVKLPDDVSVPQGKILAVVWCNKKEICPPKISFKDSINKLMSSGILSEKFAKKLHVLRDKRNSQHLYKRSTKNVSTRDVNFSVKILSELLDIIRKGKN